MHEEQQLVYRGLQPENILFDELNNVCLCDFSDSQTLEDVEIANTNNESSGILNKLHVLREEN